MLTLKVVKRINAGQGLGALRRAGSIPAVVYGPHKESTPIALSAKEFDKVFSEAGEASIVALTGIGEDIPTLIHEVDVDPLTSAPRHIDFYAVTKGEKVEVKIPLEFIGESPAVKDGANLVKVLYEIEIKADPMNLPHRFTADITSLAQIGDQIHVRNLVLPEGVELMTDADEVIALVQEVVEEKVEEPVVVDLNAIEVEKKGKEEEEGAVAAPAPEAKKEEKK
jgi:large subunit ribosomal protein L25